jgi:RNA polymerase sigma-70 factor (ECF subfamily)
LDTFTFTAREGVVTQRDEPEATDEALVAEARGGRVVALDTLLRRHESHVLRLLRLLGVPRDDREDVAQEVFVRVFRHLATFRSGRPFRGWLYRIAVNATHDYKRRMERRGRDEVAWAEGLDHEPDASPGPARIAEERERARRLEEAIATLSERERAVFVLLEIEGLGVREVAGALGITSITVRRHLGRARVHLRRLLDEIEKNPSAD